MNHDPTVQLRVRFPTSDIDCLAVIADRADTSIADLIRQAVKAYTNSDNSTEDATDERRLR